MYLLAHSPSFYSLSIIILLLQWWYLQRPLSAPSGSPCIGTMYSTIISIVYLWLLWTLSYVIELNLTCSRWCCVIIAVWISLVQTGVNAVCLIRPQMTALFNRITNSLSIWSACLYDGWVISVFHLGLPLSEVGCFPSRVLLFLCLGNLCVLLLLAHPISGDRNTERLTEHFKPIPSFQSD